MKVIIKVSIVRHSGPEIEKEIFIHGKEISDLAIAKVKKEFTDGDIRWIWSSIHSVDLKED